MEVSLTGKEITDVLKGRKTYGLYQVTQANMVNFICFDLDNHDGKHATAEFQAQVKKLVRFLLERGLKKEQILVEKSSHAGYHLWLFFKIPLLCGKAYQFVQFVQEAAEVECEGFPKQPYIDQEGYGNCIRLPLSIHRKKQERSVFTTLELEEVPFHQGIEHLARIQKIETRFVNRYVQAKPLPKPSTREGPLQGEPAKMREHCEFIRFVEQHPDQVTEPQWFLFLELCCAFGEPGIQYAYKVSSSYSQFREGEFWRKVRYIQRRGYKAPTCGKIRSLFRDCCCTPQDAGRSPARFAFK